MTTHFESQPLISQNTQIKTAIFVLILHGLLALGIANMPAVHEPVKKIKPIEVTFVDIPKVLEPVVQEPQPKPEPKIEPKVEPKPVKPQPKPQTPPPKKVVQQPKIEPKIEPKVEPKPKPKPKPIIDEVVPPKVEPVITSKVTTTVKSDYQEPKPAEIKPVETKKTDVAKADDKPSDPQPIVKSTPKADPKPATSNTSDDSKKTSDINKSDTNKKVDKDSNTKNNSDKQDNSDKQSKTPPKGDFTFSSSEAIWITKPRLSYDPDVHNPSSTSVKVTFKVDANGTVKSVSFKTGDRDLDRELKSGLMRAKFKPFMKDGFAVAGTVTITLSLD